MPDLNPRAFRKTGGLAGSFGVETREVRGGLGHLARGREDGERGREGGKAGEAGVVPELHLLLGKTEGAKQRMVVLGAQQCLFRDE